MRALAVMTIVGLVSSSALGLSTGATAPPISVKDVGGKAVHLEALRGKVVVVDFWASWCGPCKEELPFLEKLHQAYKDKGLVVLGVNIDKSEADMSATMKRSSITFQVVHDKDMAVTNQYRPSKMPSSYLIGKQGRIRYLHRGFRSADKPAIEAEIKALLAE